MTTRLRIDQEGQKSVQPPEAQSCEASFKMLTFSNGSLEGSDVSPAEMAKMIEEEEMAAFRQLELLEP